MIKLAMYKGKGMIGNAIIRFWTRSQYSHCELISTKEGANYGMSSSLMDGGVRTKEIDFASGNWDIIDLPWADEDDVKQYLFETIDEKYSWLDLIRGQFFNRPYNEEGASFCSDWCATALGIPNGTMYSPRSLYEQCVFLNMMDKAGINNPY